MVPTFTTPPPLPTHNKTRPILQVSPKRTRHRFQTILPHRIPIRQHFESPRRGTEIRPDNENEPPSFIPQTIEYAIRSAQSSTARALISGMNNLIVQLPMGRSRKHWYRMSPFAPCLHESSILALHFAEMFKGLDLTIVHANRKPGQVGQTVPWATQLSLEEFKGDSRVQRQGEKHVVIFVAACARQRALLDRAIGEAASADVVILFNCMLDAPLEGHLGFVHAYVCRAFENKCAVLLEAHDALWDVFVEIAVFEFEWVGRCVRLQEDKVWLPSVGELEDFAKKRGASRKNDSYFETKFAGCEGGFWPFMTIACEMVLPMDGASFQAPEGRVDNKSKNSRPFGFF